MGNLSAFMKEDFKKSKIIEIPGFDRFTDENGNPVMFKMKKLGYKQIQKIRDFHRTEKIAYDKRTKKAITDNGVLVKDVVYDNDKANANIVVEALVYPDLKDKEMMSFYGCNTYTDMPTAVFEPTEYVELMRRMWIVLGLIKPDEDDDDYGNDDAEPRDEIEEAKN